MDLSVDVLTALLTHWVIFFNDEPFSQQPTVIFKQFEALMNILEAYLSARLRFVICYI